MKDLLVKVFVVSLLLCALSIQQAGAAPPTDFQTSLVVGSGLNGPSGFEFAPDGRIFIIERTGKVKIYKNGQLLPTPFTDNPSASSGDRGQIGIAFDPDWQTNQYVYFYYTSSTDQLNYLVRYNAAGDVGTDKTILYHTNSPSDRLHVGGSIRFGPDGKLYFAVGDNGYAQNAQNLANPHGKILRINKDGTVPIDNPFYNQAGKLPEIWAYGLRNPWRFQFDGATGELFGGDVGNFTWEEINRIVRGGNYGWPLVEGKYVVGAALMLCILMQAMTSVTHAATRYETGITTGATLLRMNNKDLNQRLIDIQRLGATWIRVDFNWPAIQPANQKAYDWKMYDRIVRVAGSRNLKILGVLGYTPRWAQEPRCAKLVITLAAGQKCNPKSTELFARFTRAAALRYKSTSVRGWEIWNEPNLSSYWKTAQPANNRIKNAVHADPVAYAKFANAAALQIRRSAPDTVVITGGLAPLWEPKYPKGLRQNDFLEQLLPRLDPALFHAVGIHPYSWPTPPGKAVIHNAFYSVDQGREEYNLRAIMEKTGFGAKQIWGTEYGAPTQGKNSLLKLGRPDHVTEASQAQMIAQGIREWYDKPNVGPLMVHSDSDRWLPQRKKNEGSFGLRRYDGTKKPAYDALQKAVKELQ